MIVAAICDTHMFYQYSRRAFSNKCENLGRLRWMGDFLRQVRPLAKYWQE